MIQIPRPYADAIGGVASDFGATTHSRVPARDARGREVELLVVTMENAAVGPLLERAQDIADVEVSVASSGAFAFAPPHDHVPDELVDVTSLSPYEVVLSGRQSVGGWVGFLTFAVVAAVVVWLGLTTGASYLLIGAMLVAPFAGPAVNTAIGLASGRPALLRRAVLRYVAGIAMTALTCALLTVVLGPDLVPRQLVEVLTLTTTTVVLPLGAGVAAASLLVQSEHSSLISGASVGVLVAASLAPPAGGLGIALAVGRGDLALYAGFVVALQLAGITTTGTLVLWAYGVRPTGQRSAGGAARLAYAGVALAAVITVGLVVVQVELAPGLRRGTHQQQALAQADRVVDTMPGATLVDATARVASPEGTAPQMLVDLVVRADAGPRQGEEIDAVLTRRLLEQFTDIEPHVSVEVLPEE